MNGLYVGIFLVLAIGGFIAWHFLTKRKRELTSETDRAHDGMGTPKHRRNFKHNGISPKGINWRSTVPVPQSVLENAERAAQYQIDILKLTPGFEAYTEGLTVSGMKIDFVDPSGINEVNDPGSPMIIIGGQQAAAAVLGMHEQFEEIKLNPILVLPHQQAQDWQFVDYLFRCVWYEAEHRTEFLNRHLAPENLWMNYIGGDAHPHRPDPRPTAVGFTSETSQPVCGMSLMTSKN